MTGYRGDDKHERERQAVGEQRGAHRELEYGVRVEGYVDEKEIRRDSPDDSDAEAARDAGAVSAPQLAQGRGGDRPLVYERFRVSYFTAYVKRQRHDHNT